jgi:serine/threonine protein kinase
LSGELDELPTAPGLTFVREIGHGGMATVYEALDRKRGPVAVKVLKSTDPERIALFQGECALVRRIDHAAVVPVYDMVVTDQGRIGCTLELIDGSTLHDLRVRGEVPAARAVAVIASAARALAAVHEAGIVHRDVKPANLLIERSGRVRLLDFGVAKDMQASPSRSGAIAGTPHYLAPEQAQAVTTTPATDVWGLGVVLYSLLTGTMPFDSPSLRDLIFQIVASVPRSPRSLNPALDAATEAIVLRCLEKAPHERYPTGAALAAALEAVLPGSVADALAPVTLVRPAAPVVPPPPPKPVRDDAAVHHRWTWELASSPRELWPLVSDTDKFNRAIGLPPVEFSDEPDPRGGLTKIGKFRRLGMDLEWVEHPFEWVAPERQSVLRVYRRGPLEALWSEVTIEPRPGGGSTLIHELWITSKGALGRVASFVELRFRTKNRIEEVYRRLDAAAKKLRTAQDGMPTLHDAFDAGISLAPGGAAFLAKGLASLAASGKPWAALVPRLEATIRETPDAEALRLRPYALARRWEARPRQVFALLAAAVKAGLLGLTWQLLCPRCRVSTRSLDSLAGLSSKVHCEACNLSFETDLARSVELVFKPEPAIRAIPDETYCLGGPGVFPQVVVQQELEPGEERTLKIELLPGSYRVVARGVRSVYPLHVSKEDLEAAAEVTIEENGLKPGPSLLRAGSVFLTFRNASARRRVVRLEDVAFRTDALTALEACGSTELQGAFGTLAPGERLRVTAATWLAVAAPDGLGPKERQAFEDRLCDVVFDCGGAIVPRPGGPGAASETIAAFAETTGAVEAAIQLFLRAAPGLRAALHYGPALAKAAGSFLGYEGEAIEATLALLGECQPGEIAATHPVLGAPGVGDLIGTRETRTQPVRVSEEGYIPVVYLRGAV